MLTQTLRIQVIDWQDRDFVDTFEAALVDAQAGHAGAANVDAAREVQAALRASGYLHASVECRASVDEVLRGVVRWTVCRGPLPHPHH